MPAGHYPVQKVSTAVIGFESDPDPGPDPCPVLPVRPAHPKVELRDGSLRLRGLAVKKNGAKPCVKRVRAIVSARVTFRKGGRKVTRVVRSGKALKLRPAGSACRVTGAIRLKGRLAGAKKVTLQMVGKRLKKSKRTVRAKSTVAVQGGKLR